MSARIGGHDHAAQGMADEMRLLDAELRPQRFQVGGEFIEAERSRRALRAAMAAQIVGDAAEVRREFRDDAVPDLAAGADAVGEEHGGTFARDLIVDANRLNHGKTFLGGWLGAALIVSPGPRRCRCPRPSRGRS